MAGFTSIPFIINVNSCPDLSQHACSDGHPQLSHAPLLQEYINPTMAMITNNKLYLMINFQKYCKNPPKNIFRIKNLMLVLNYQKLKPKNKKLKDLTKI